MSYSAVCRDLPPEVLMKIFGYLSVGDRLIVRLVSKSWYMASLSPCFMDKIVILISNYFSSALKVFSDTDGYYFHCTLKEIDLNLKSPNNNYWESFAEHLKSLSLQNCDISEEHFVMLLESCKALEDITISGCSGLFMSGNLLSRTGESYKLKSILKKLKSFTISSNRYLSDSIFGSFINLMPNLNSLSLSGTQIAFHPAIYRRFYPTGNEQLSESVLTFQSIVTFLSPLAKSLSCLDFSRTNIDNRSLLNLLDIPNLFLKSIYLTSCDQLTPNGIIQFARGQPALELIDISLSTRLNDAAVNAIVNNCPLLKALHLRGCREVTGESIKNVNKLAGLTSLNLSRLENVDSEAILTGLCNPSMNITWLCLASTSVSESNVIKISENLVNLKYLDLTSCFEGVTDLSTAAICKHLTKLEVLRLAWCERVSDIGLIGDLYDPNLQMQIHTDTESLASTSFQPTRVSESDSQDSLNIKNRGRIGHSHNKLDLSRRFKEMVSSTTDTTTAKGHETACFSDLKDLKEIDLCSCTRISDQTLVKSFYFNQLSHLNLSLCQKISDVGLVALGPKVKGLTVLFLNQCSNITDTGFCSLVKYLVRLRQLDVQGCKHLSNESLSAISFYCKSLQYLDVSVCSAMTLEGVEDCEKHLGNLNTVHKRCLKSSKE